jgi:hypothetical protein
MEQEIVGVDAQEVVVSPEVAVEAAEVVEVVDVTPVEENITQ